MILIKVIQLIVDEQRPLQFFLQVYKRVRLALLVPDWAKSVVLYYEFLNFAGLNLNVNSYGDKEYSDQSEGWDGV